MVTEKKLAMAARLIPDETIIQRGIGTAMPGNPLY
jgi:hypothetical protein